jgi:hypothetical protein
VYADRHEGLHHEKSQTGVIRREAAIIELLRITCTHTTKLKVELCSRLVSRRHDYLRRSLIALGENTSTLPISPWFVLNLVLINHDL